MMRFENSKYFKELNPKKIEFHFGTLYLCEQLFVAEINEGVHYDWEMIKKGAEELIVFYGTEARINYISNRINSYSVDPYSWKKVEMEYDLVISNAIVVYNDYMLMNAALEKQFSKKPFKQFSNLDKAIEWLLESKSESNTAKEH